MRCLLVMSGAVMVHGVAASRAYHIGTPGRAWGRDEVTKWRAQFETPKRSYQEEVRTKIEALSGEFEVVKYGALPCNPERYPLFSLRTRAWDAAKPCVLVTGGVHGYETSGVQGALRFLETEAARFAAHFNILVVPCVSPWGYEHIQRWNIDAIDPNRSFKADGQAEEAQALRRHLKALGVQAWLCHVDLHETTDTDETEFRPAKAARDGEESAPDSIPDGFYLVGDLHNQKNAWYEAVLKEVGKVTHIAPADEKGNIIGEKVVQPGVILLDAPQLGLCAGTTGASYATTTEVYPDSPSATDEQCNAAQVAAVVGALESIMAMEGIGVMQKQEL